MNWLYQYLKEHDVTRHYIQGKGNFAHLSVLQEAMLLTGSYLKSQQAQIIVKENEQEAATLVDTLRKIKPDLRVVYYTHEESLRVEAIVQSEITKANRIDALYRILTKDFDICVTTAIASVRKCSDPKTLKENILHLQVGFEIDPKELSKKLVEMGYTRVKYVEQPFTFSMRGGVCDIYSIQMDTPIRIEFFDIEIESMRSFDINTQRSIDRCDDVEIVFANDVILSEVDKQDISQEIDKRLEGIDDQELLNNIEMKKDQLLHGMYDTTLYPFLGYWEGASNFYDFVADYEVVLSPYEAIVRQCQHNMTESIDFLEEQYTMKEMLVVDHLFTALPDGKNIRKFYEFQSEMEVSIPWHEANIISENVQQTLKWLRKEAITQRVYLIVEDEDMERMLSDLVNAGMDYQLMVDNPTQPGIYVYPDALELGFSLDDEKIVVYTQHELFKYKIKRYRYDNKFSKAETLNQLQDLDESDYVVHRQYGIGRYLGITTKEIEGFQKDFMRIMYKDGDELFVPLEQFSLVRKYMSSEASAVRLSKLGSSTWQKNKEKVQRDVAEVADKLVNLYASRMDAPGYAFQADTDYQKQFEAEFEYELTPDQKLAVQEIKADMERAQPMDRLLIGDVGFGKTEVAIRAAFKAFVDTKQVVFLCPTTILSAQHTRTFKERFKNYPIVVEVLNRFVSDKEQKDIIERVKAGKVDVLIGTHRVLSKDIQFKDLGLLIIDEEQRFGVEHKERIKEFKVSVDVLSLSATPIPRTLQMSLIGLRSLSQLNTPPSNRLPVMTYVIEKNDNTLYDIIRKEIARGGQSFYLYNNVERIYGVASAIDQAIDEARVAIIHGKMDRHEIEDVMIQFLSKEVNVLVCTTIIETGIDIPNANTIIVDNAHRFGLSQLYQIKGRVGRSDRLAYAYFVVPPKQSLTEVATKRLQAIKEFTQLGSGYKIAMRDLTIRGAGELLGGNQSGFIDTVGIDLYVQLLKEAIAKRKGETLTETEENNLNLKMNAFLPENFASDDGEKLEIYQGINNIDTLESLNEYEEVMEDRYGQLPASVAMLLEKTRLEIFLKDDRIDSFKERVNRVELSFTDTFSQNVDGVHLFELVSSRSAEMKLKYVNQKITLTMPIYQNWAEDLIYILKNIKEQDHETR